MSVQDRLFALITSSMGIPAEELSPQATMEELELDSLALVELGVVVEKEFGVVVDSAAITPESTLGGLLGLLETPGVASR
jgi:acyl carrier protein